jgi:ferric-dicitrate binding protein FerR (iron transport regulator)
MVKKLNTDFLSLLKNEKFIRLVQQSENPPKLLERLRARYPDDAEAVRYAFEFIRTNMQEKREMEPDDFNRILNNILRHAKNRKRAKTQRIFISYLSRAAVVLLILSLGTLLVINQLKVDSIEQFAQTITDDSSQSVIVLSDGTKRLLKYDDSVIEYDSDAQEVVVRKDENEAERIENRKELGKQVLNQIIVPYGQKQTIALSDGTVIQLNAGSSLTFPAKFTGKSRDVYLKGEGYFEVHKNENLPFIVKTEYMNVKVLGTSFNISAYNDEKTVSTVLVEGKVKVATKDRMFLNDEYVMKPGEGFFYTAGSGKPVLESVDVNDYISWKDGIFIFTEKPLVEIVRRVKKYYNKPIQIEGEELAHTLVTGKLDISGDFELAMQYLAKTIEGRYEKTPDDVFVLKTPVLQ